MLKGINTLGMCMKGTVHERDRVAGLVNRYGVDPVDAQMPNVLEHSYTRLLTKPKNTNKDLDVFNYNILFFKILTKRFTND